MSLRAALCFHTQLGYTARMREELESTIRGAARERFSRSGGPGGQNVNKVNTQVTLHVPLSELGLTDDERARVETALAGRISGEGELVVQVSQTRSQAQNREIAVERAVELLAEALTPRRPRKPTRPSRAARERRLEGKKRSGERKRFRRPPEEP